LDGLLYSQDDVDASSNFVLLHWHEREGTAYYSDDSATSLAHQSNVMEIFDVTPVKGSDPDDGEFQCEGNHFNMYTDNPGPTVIIMYTAYLIMKQASPRMTPHIVFQLGLHPGLDVILEDIDYGPVKGIHENYVNWSRILAESDVTVSYDDHDDGEQTDYWYSMLTQEGKTDEEILHDAWQGPGNMWVFVRPDRFVLVTFKNTSIPINRRSAASLLQRHWQRNRCW
jgi:hypothetical protein